MKTLPTVIFFIRLTMKYLLLLVLALSGSTSLVAQKFIHPGINQTSADLEFMRTKVLAGEQPWKDAFDRVKQKTDLDFQVQPFAHVMRGPYGRPNIGGNELSKSASMAYNAALLWYITK